MSFICTCGHRRGQHASNRETVIEGRCCTSGCSCVGFTVRSEDEARFRLQIAVESSLKATTGRDVSIFTHVLIGYLAPLAEVIVEEAVRRMQEPSS